MVVLTATRVVADAGAPEGAAALAGGTAAVWEGGRGGSGLAGGRARLATGAAFVEGRAGETGAIVDDEGRVLALAVAAAVAVAAPAAGKAQVAAWLCSTGAPRSAESSSMTSSSPKDPGDSAGSWPPLAWAIAAPLGYGTWPPDSPSPAVGWASRSPPMGGMAVAIRGPVSCQVAWRLAREWVNSLR